MTQCFDVIHCWLDTVGCLSLLSVLLGLLFKRDSYRLYQVSYLTPEQSHTLLLLTSVRVFLPKGSFHFDNERDHLKQGNRCLTTMKGRSSCTAWAASVCVKYKVKLIKGNKRRRCIHVSRMQRVKLFASVRYMDDLCLTEEVIGV
jgi:hypothetical protein